MTRLRPAPAWRDRLRAAAHAPPLRPRVPLWCGGERIGSVEPDLFERAGLDGSAALRHDAARGGWTLEGEPTASLAHIAQALRDTGLGHAWRDEQLAVRGEGGTLVGTIERAAVRPLGIATHAVHLTALDDAGRVWVQQRAFDKPTDPGLWDTLVGGMVPARDSVEQALERETWEEAGLRLPQVRALRHGGRVATQRPFAELAHGYVVEVLDWYAGTLPAGVVPANQDGEVAGFRTMAADELTQRLEAGEFTIDAALILLAAYAA